jgi:hypothetical protein
MFWGYAWVLIVLAVLMARISGHLDQKTHGWRTFVDRSEENDHG